MFMYTILGSILGGWQLVAVVLVVLLLFGGKKIPEFARSLVQGIKEFKKAKRESNDEEPKSDESTVQKNDAQH